jgi:hypothetical protein
MQPPSYANSMPAYPAQQGGVAGNTNVNMPPANTTSLAVAAGFKIMPEPKRPFTTKYIWLLVLVVILAVMIVPMVVLTTKSQRDFEDKKREFQS